MTAYKDLSKEELLELKKGLEARFEEIKAKGLSLDMSRGKPAADQLNLSMGMMDVLNSSEELTCANGVDCRNYGGPGRHERLVTVGGFGKQEGLHKKKQRRFISCT